MADPWADPVGGGWGSTAAAAPVGSPRKFSMTQSVDKRMTMGGPTMVPYRESPVTSPLVRRRRRPTHRATIRPFAEIIFPRARNPDADI